MPPFRAGLQKRKIIEEETKKEATKSQLNDTASDSGSEQELLGAGLDAGLEDDTDSEHEEADVGDSDTERDGVLFDEDVDSTLGDEEGQTEEASDESSVG